MLECFQAEVCLNKYIVNHCEKLSWHYNAKFTGHQALSFLDPLNKNYLFSTYRCFRLETFMIMEMIETFSNSDITQSLIDLSKSLVELEINLVLI